MKNEARYSNWLMCMTAACLALSMTCVPLTIAQQDAKPHYRVILLPIEHDNIRGYSFGINNADHVVGYMFADFSYPFSAFLYDGNTVTDLGRFDNLSYIGEYINDLDQVAVLSRFESDGTPATYYWDRQTGLVDLGLPNNDEYVVPAGIGNYGMIAMTWKEGDTFTPPHAYTWFNGALNALDLFDPKMTSSCNSVNHAGDILGYGWTPSGSDTIIWEDGAPSDFPNLNLGDSWGAREINDRMHVAGLWQKHYDLPLNIYIWRSGKVNTVGTLMESNPLVLNLRMNNSDEIVWVDHMRNGPYMPFVIRGDQLYYLNDLLDPGWTTSYIADINDAGIIVGSAYNPDVGANVALFIPTELRMAGPVPGVAGRVNILRAINVTPGSRVWFVYGRTDGQTRVPGCPGLSVNIAHPHIIGSAIADQDGTARLQMYVPPSESGRLILLQALERDNCTVTPVVAHKWP